MAEEAAEKKVVTWLFLAIGEPARKMFKGQTSGIISLDIGSSADAREMQKLFPYRT